MSRSTLLTSLTAVAFAFLATAASAQVTPAAGYTPPDDTPAIRVGITLFPVYTFQTDPKISDSEGNNASKNSFDVARSYINITGNVSHIVAFRITPDITRESGLLSSRPPTACRATASSSASNTPTPSSTSTTG